MHDADADDLQREDCRRHGRAKQCGEACAHAVHDDVLVVGVEPDNFAHVIGDTAALLDRRALPSGRAAEEMRNDRGHKNQRLHAERNAGGGVVGRDDHVGAFVIGFLKETIQKHDGQTAKGKAQNHCRMCGAELVDRDQHMAEHGCEHNHDHAGHAGQNKPLDHCLDGKNAAFHVMPQLFPDFDLRHEQDFRFFGIVY